VPPSSSPLNAALIESVMGTSVPLAAMEILSPFITVTTLMVMPPMVSSIDSRNLSGNMEAVSCVNSASPTPGSVILPLFLFLLAICFVKYFSPPWALIALARMAFGSSSAARKPLGITRKAATRPPRNNRVLEISSEVSEPRKCHS